MKDVQEGRVDMVSFAKLYITNPDLYLRIQHGWPVNKETNMATWFGGAEKGYIDYPVSEQHKL